MLNPFSRKKETKSKVDFDDCEDESELDVQDIIEIVVKDNQISLKEIKTKINNLVSDLHIVSELKAEIKALKAELMEEKKFNRELITQLVNKPAAPSAAALHIQRQMAREEEEKSSKSKSGFAAMDRKAS